MPGFLDIQYGQVVAVNGGAYADNGQPSPTIGIESYLDGSLLTMPLAAAGWEQCMPLLGYKVLYLRVGQHQGRIIKFWGNDENFTRKGQFGLDAGEVFIQSPSGLAYIKLDENGGVQIVSGDTISSLTFGDTGALLKSTQVTMQTQNGSVQMGDSGNLNYQKTDANGKVLVSLAVDDSNNIIGSAQGDISLKGQNIYLDGKVALGVGATNPNTRATWGPMVTGSPTGTYPADFTTGAPIPGSSDVIASGDAG